MVAYNLMSLFKHRVMGDKSSPSLASVRLECIALGSYIVHRGRAIILKIAAKDRNETISTSCSSNWDCSRSVQSDF